MSERERVRQNERVQETERERERKKEIPSLWRNKQNTLLRSKINWDWLVKERESKRERKNVRDREKKEIVLHFGENNGDIVW